MTFSLALAQQLTAATASLAFAWLLAGIIVFSRKVSFYSQRRQTISELGAHGTKHSRVVSFAVFLPVGLLVIAFCFFFTFAAGTYPSVQQAMWLFAMVGLGYIGGAIFPCDVSAPMFGTWRNNIHVAFGVAEYLGGAAALYLLQDFFSRTGQPLTAQVMMACAFAVIGGVLAMQQAWLMNWRGLAQRVAEGGLFFAMLWLGLVAV
ncbi:MAG: DUF998 domain-containing protein [Gammaproteobacteria bacterium]|nr:DUF998 domain-containing protein [Gammaproteobacteria bacterium]